MTDEIPRNSVMRLYSGSLEFIGIGSAIDELRRLAENGDIVVGLEGFLTDGRTIQPMMDYIAPIATEDAQPNDRPSRAFERASKVLSHWQEGPMFVVITTRLREPETNSSTI